MKNNQKLKGKDLINIGIYAAIYCVLMTCISMLGYIPIMMPMLTVIVPIILGVPMMLFYTKVKKFGMITIMATIVGIYLCVTGMGFWPTLFGVVFGFLADLIAKSGSYASGKKSILSYGTFCVLLFGNYLPLYIDSCKPLIQAVEHSNQLHKTADGTYLYKVIFKTNILKICRSDIQDMLDYAAQHHFTLQQEIFGFVMGPEIRNQEKGYYIRLYCLIQKDAE